MITLNLIEIMSMLFVLLALQIWLTLYLHSRNNSVWVSVGCGMALPLAVYVISKGLIIIGMVLTSIGTILTYMMQQVMQL